MKNEHLTQAMGEEMEALETDSKWEIVDKPNDKKVVECKQIFTKTHKVDGGVDRYETRLVAKKYSQTYEIDYERLFHPCQR